MCVIYGVRLRILNVLVKLTFAFVQCRVLRVVSLIEERIREERILFVHVCWSWWWFG